MFWVLMFALVFIHFGIVTVEKGSCERKEYWNKSYYIHCISENFLYMVKQNKTKQNLSPLSISVFCNIVDSFHEKFSLNTVGTHSAPHLNVDLCNQSIALGYYLSRPFSGHLPTTLLPKGHAQLSSCPSLSCPQIPCLWYQGARNSLPQIYPCCASWPTKVPSRMCLGGSGKGQGGANRIHIQLVVSMYVLGF